MSDRDWLSLCVSSEFEMGGGEARKGDEQQRQLTLQARTEYQRLNATCRHDLTVMARISAPEVEEESRRAAVNICAVIDRR